MHNIQLSRERHLEEQEQEATGNAAAEVAILQYGLL